MLMCRMANALVSLRFGVFFFVDSPQLFSRTYAKVRIALASGNLSQGVARCSAMRNDSCCFFVRRFNLTERALNDRLEALGFAVQMVPITVSAMNNLYKNRSIVDTSDFLLLTTYHGSCVSTMYGAPMILTQVAWSSGFAGRPASRACAAVTGTHAKNPEKNVVRPKHVLEIPPPSARLAAFPHGMQRVVVAAQLLRAFGYALVRAFKSARAGGQSLVHPITHLCRRPLLRLLQGDIFELVGKTIITSVTRNAIFPARRLLPPPHFLPPACLSALDRLALCVAACKERTLHGLDTDCSLDLLSLLTDVLSAPGRPRS